jgi:hypothetical protein
MDTISPMIAGSAWSRLMSGVAQAFITRTIA